MTVGDLVTWNPGAKADCTNLWGDTWQCVGIIGGVSLPKPTKVTNGIETPAPLHGPTIPDCSRFAYVPEGSDCATLVRSNNITLGLLVEWNPLVKAECTGLWAKTWVCVGKIGFHVPLPQSSPSSTRSGDQVGPTSPPLPLSYQNMDPRCKKTYRVTSQDGCSDIVHRSRISWENFFAWNPDLDRSCSNLYVGYYVCIKI